MSQRRSVSFPKGVLEDKGANQFPLGPIVKVNQWLMITPDGGLDVSN